MGFSVGTGSVPASVVVVLLVVVMGAWVVVTSGSVVKASMIRLTIADTKNDFRINWICLPFKKTITMIAGPVKPMRQVGQLP